MKPQPVFGMMFRFANEIARADAAALLRMRRRHGRGSILRAEAGAYYFEGLLLRTR